MAHNPEQHPFHFEHDPEKGQFSPGSSPPRPEPQPHDGGVNQPELHPPTSQEHPGGHPMATEREREIDDADSPLFHQSPTAAERWALLASHESESEGSVIPEKLRHAGYLLRAVMANELIDPVKQALSQDHIAQGLDSNTFDIRDIPAEIYVDKFAQVYGLKAAVLKEWTHTTSMQIATMLLPFEYEQLEEIERNKEHWCSLTEEGTDPVADQREGLLEPVARVAEHGLQAAYVDHHLVVTELIMHDTSQIVDTTTPHIQALSRAVFQPDPTQPATEPLTQEDILLAAQGNRKDRQRTEHLITQYLDSLQHKGATPEALAKREKAVQHFVRYLRHDYPQRAGERFVHRKLKNDLAYARDSWWQFVESLDEDDETRRKKDPSWVSWYNKNRS